MNNTNFAMLQARINKDILDAFKIKCIQTGKSRQQVITMLINKWLAEPPKIDENASN